MTTTKRQKPLKKGDRVWAAGKPGTVTSFSKDGQRVPWIKLDDGQNWDARDLSSVSRIPTVLEAAEKLLAVSNTPGVSRNSFEWLGAWEWLERAVAEEHKAKAPTQASQEQKQ